MQRERTDTPNIFGGPKFDLEYLLFISWYNYMKNCIKCLPFLLAIAKDRKRHNHLPLFYDTHIYHLFFILSKKRVHELFGSALPAQHRFTALL